MKTSKLLLICCLIGICFVSCENKKQYKNTEYFSLQSFPEHISLKGEILPLEIISKPKGLACRDSILFVNNTAVENLIYCYNLNTYQKIGEFIPFGSGPNEMLGIRNICIDEGNVWISSFQPSKLYQYDINQFRRQQQVLPLQEIEIPDGTLNSIIPLNDNEIVTTSYRSEDNRLSLYDYSGRHIKDMGEYPEFGNELTANERHEAFLCTLVKLPNQRILLAYMNTDLLEIYSVDGTLIKRMHGPDQFFPSVSEKKVPAGKMVFDNEDAKGAYYNPLLIGDEVWIIYSGSSFTPKGPDSNDHLLQRKIFIFDQEMNPVKAFLLDIPMATLAVDPVDRTFYGLSMQPDVVVVKYRY